MRIWTREQALEIDRRTTEKISLDSLVEAAGRGCAEAIRPLVPSKKVTVLAGPGLNGADAKVVARILAREWKFQVRIFENPDHALLAAARDSSLIDGLFGTGLNRVVAPEWATLFETLNAMKADVLAIDIPSGVQADTGIVLGGALRARVTLTLGAPKPGHFLGEGAGLRGKLKIIPMPFDSALTRKVANSVFLLGRPGARKLLPPRSDTSHKYKHGELLCAAGSLRYRGAAVLTARAALRMGVGFVHVASTEEIFPEWFEIPETLFHKISIVQRMPEKWSKLPWAVGPGFEGDASGLIDWMRKNGVQKAALDAAALRALAEKPRTLPESWVLTPHAGEAAALLGTTVAAVEADRLKAARDLAQKFSCIALLKGFRTIIAYGEKCWIINSGNSGLAKAGSGDVLTGMIGSLLAQIADPLHATLLAAWIHGGLADQWVREGRDRASLTPSDLIERLPVFLKLLRASSSSVRKVNQ